MIIQIIYQHGVFSLETESQSPIAVYRDSPMPQ